MRTASRRQDGRGSSFYPIVCCSGQVLGQLLMTQSSWPCCHLGRMIRTALWVTCGASSIHLFASHSLPLGTDIWTDQLFEGFQSTLLVSPRMVRRRPVNRSTNNISETSSMPEWMGPALLQQESRPVAEIHLYQPLGAAIVAGAGCCGDTQEGLPTEPEGDQGRSRAEGKVGLSLKG